MWDLPTRAWTRVPCISRQILNHCATREARACFLYTGWKRKCACYSSLSLCACPLSPTSCCFGGLWGCREMGNWPGRSSVSAAGLRWPWPQVTATVTGVGIQPQILPRERHLGEAFRVCHLWGRFTHLGVPPPAFCLPSCKYTWAMDQHAPPVRNGELRLTLTCWIRTYMLTRARVMWCSVKFEELCFQPPPAPDSSSIPLFWSTLPLQTDFTLYVFRAPQVQPPSTHLHLENKCRRGKKTLPPPILGSLSGALEIQLTN